MATTSINPCISLPLLFFSSFFLLSNTHLCIAADTLSLGQSLSGNRTVVSKGGTFELGFFSPGNSRNHYVGIWFKTMTQKTVVWVANREKPLRDPTSSELKISGDGELVLLDQSKIPVWSSNSSLSSRTSNSTVAVLLDTGNLVLRRGGSTDSDVLWQSFDHPGNTLLPGARIGFNRTTGQVWKLTSWKNSEDPSPGLFTLELDPSGITQCVIEWNRTRTFWTSGVWDGHIFSSVPEMMALHEYSIKPFASANATYFTYSDSEINGLSSMWMDVSGQWKWQRRSEGTQSWLVFSFMPRDPCDVYSRCGSFGACSHYITPSCKCLPGFEPESMEKWSLGDQNGGCVRKTQLQCASNSSINGQKDGFLMMPNVRLPINSRSLAVQSAEDCELACSNDCSCTAYSYDSRCLVWNGGLLNLKQLTSGEVNAGKPSVLHLRLAKSELPRPLGKKRTANAALLGGVLAGFAAALACIVSALVWRNHRRRSIGRASAVQGFLMPFRYKDLKSTTKNFSDKLGKGGFGSVFKGTLPDSSVVAVKKLEGLGQGDKQFRMEVSAMGTVQHVNIVRLRGFCCEGAKRLLVYDYMPNGSLDSYLYPKSSKTLEWSRRYQIAVGTARGLAYLHEKCRERIIHCDVKPENILLDEEFCPKVADFGMAKLVGRDFSRVLTTMRGTIGYLAPEWISGVPITPKADVYSFGMMLFEIISGRRNGEESEEGKPSFFPTWAAKEINQDEATNHFQYYAFEGDTDMEEVRRACRIACWCIQERESVRPSMGQIVQMLEGILEVEMPPIPKLLQNLVANGDEIFYMLEMHSFACSKVSSSVVST